MSVAAAVLAAQLAAGQPPIGLAELSGDGRLCVALPGPKLTAGSPITVVRTDPPQAAAVVLVEQDTPGCQVFERADLSRSYYFYLATRSKEMAAADGAWVAVAGRRPTRRREEVVTVDVGRAYPNARVRSCASNEGLHFTVWAGTPLRSRRLWHEYFYLGYDVEPSCQPADYKE